MPINLETGDPGMVNYFYTLPLNVQETIKQGGVDIKTEAELKTFVANYTRPNDCCNGQEGKAMDSMKEYKVAELPKCCKPQLTSLEERLKSEYGEDVVLIAYKKEQ